MKAKVDCALMASRSGRVLRVENMVGANTALYKLMEIMSKNSGDFLT